MQTPGPAAQHPISRRLRSVREDAGLNLREFHQHVSAGVDGREPFDVSESAVRNYDYDREPPASFLARVADVFGVRLEWLIAGRGEMRPAAPVPAGTSVGDQEFARAITDALLAALPEFFPAWDSADGRPVTRAARGALFELATEHLMIQLNRAGRYSAANVVAESVADLVAQSKNPAQLVDDTICQVLQAVAGPANSLGLPIQGDTAAHYVLRACALLAPLMRELLEHEWWADATG
jgi:transcriptional regulator with XRE-family HTH domain